MASFQAKRGQERLRKRKKKKFSFRPVPTRPGIQNSKKRNIKKIKKIKKHDCGYFSRQNGTGLAEKVRKNNYRSDQFLPAQEQRISKKQQ